MRFGDAIPTERTFHEQYIQTDMGAVTVPTLNAENTYNVGSFTMPFAGSAVLNFLVRLEWINGELYTYAHVGQSTPAPADATYNTWRDGHDGPTFGSKADIPAAATWTGLAKGQVVTLRASIYVALLNPKFDYFFGFARMFKA